MTDPVCVYCRKPCTWAPTSAHLYSGRDFGPVWECQPCRAWVGCHRDGAGPHRRPLGTPADADDRDKRQRAHALFDPLWRRVMERDGVSQGVARSRAYRWLAEQLRVPPERCHIGMMHGRDLERVAVCCTQPLGLPWARCAGCGGAVVPQYEVDALVRRLEALQPQLEEVRCDVCGDGSTEAARW